MPVTTGPEARCTPAASSHGAAFERIVEAMDVDEGRVPRGVDPETSAGGVRDSVPVAPKLLRRVGPEVGVGRSQDSAPAGVRPLRGCKAGQSVAGDRDSVRRNLSPSHAPMVLYLDGEERVRGVLVLARLLREEWAARARDRGVPDAVTLTEITTASLTTGKDRKFLPLLPLNPQPRLMIGRLSENEGLR